MSLFKGVCGATFRWIKEFLTPKNKLSSLWLTKEFFNQHAEIYQSHHYAAFIGELFNGLMRLIAIINTGVSLVANINEPNKARFFLLVINRNSQ